MSQDSTAAGQNGSIVFVKRDQRLTTESGSLLMQSLGIGLRNQQLEPFAVTVEPASETVGEPIVHPGQEFVYCLAGVVEYLIAGQSYHLQEGDSLLFEATQPHCFRSTGNHPAELLLVFQTVEGSHLARQRHMDV